MFAVLARRHNSLWCSVPKPDRLRAAALHARAPWGSMQCQAAGRLTTRAALAVYHVTEKGWTKVRGNDVGQLHFEYYPKQEEHPC